MWLSWCMFRSLIPASLGLTENEQRRVVRDAMRRWRGTRGSHLVTAITCVLIVPVIVMISSRRYGISGLVPDWAELPILMAATFGVVLGGVCLARFFGLPRWVYAELRDLGHDVCARCGYHRAGLDPLAVCPECGAVRLAPVSGEKQ